MLTQARLKELLHYDPETGVFTWLVAKGSVNAGDVTGRAGHGCYPVVRVDRRNYKAHRLAWLYQTGSWPAGDIDHINGIPSDNRWANLREATVSQNLANAGRRSDNISGYKGVSWHKQSQRWTAKVAKDGRGIYLGLYDTPEDAHAAYMAAAREHFGEFARAA